jgi:hypothetical protein
MVMALLYNPVLLIARAFSGFQRTLFDGDSAKGSRVQTLPLDESRDVEEYHGRWLAKFEFRLS